MSRHDNRLRRDAVAQFRCFMPCFFCREKGEAGGPLSGDFSIKIIAKADLKG